MLIILDPGKGQMCNQMLMQANVLASAYARGYKVVYYGFKKYDGPAYEQEKLSELLTAKQRTPLVRTTITKLLYKAMKFVHLKNRRIIAGDDSKAISDVLESGFLKNHTTLCCGWPFYDLETLRENGDLVRQYFRPNQDMQIYLDQQIASLKDKGTGITVGVHMRRGDYKSWRGGQFYFSDEVYKSYMDQLCDQLPDEQKVMFILFSNEAIDLGHFTSDRYQCVTATGTAMQDFYLMGNLDYLIGPPSTFSGLASFLGKIPRYIVMKADDQLRKEDMHIWLQETDGWVTPI